MADDYVHYSPYCAEIEVAHAQQARTPEVVAAHYKLAEADLERITAEAPIKQNENA